MCKKICTVCKIEKDIAEFHKRSAARDGLRSECKECGRLNTLKYIRNNKDKIHIINKRRYAKYYEKIKEQHKEYRNRNKEKLNNYILKRLKIDPKFRAIWNIRNRARAFLRDKTKQSHTLGCSFNEFIKHIESQFQPGMNWSNHGSDINNWHLDHRYPLSRAYEEGPESFAKACNYKNLQPLWSMDNLKKGNRV